MFTDPEEVAKIMNDLCDRQWKRLFDSHEKAEPFLARPQEVATTAEIAIYEAILKTLQTL